MLAAHLAHRRLDLRADLVRAGIRAFRPVRQAAKTALAVAGDPAVHALAAHLIPGGDLGHRHPSRGLQDRAVTLLNNRQDPGQRGRHTPLARATTAAAQRLCASIDGWQGLMRRGICG